MVNILKLKAAIVEAGLNQRTMLEEIHAAGYEMGVNTLNKKINGRSPITCDDADIFCQVLRITDNNRKCDIFLA